MGSSAFSGCSGLTSINVDSGNSTYDSRNNCNAIIETASNTLIKGCLNTVIPNNVTSIGEGAFRDCSSLTSITIPNSVTSIGNNAFDGCSGLTSVTIPNSVTSIGINAFANCSDLTSVTIPNSVTSIGRYAFSGCSGMTSINVDSNNSIYDSRNNCNAIIKTASNTLIAGCQNSIIPSSVTNIGEDAFFGCRGLTSVTIPNSVTTIGGSAFYGCSGMTFVTIPNSVTTIGRGAFEGCSSLTSITIPNSVTSIGRLAFYGCSGLTSINVDSDNSIYDSRDNCNAIIETASNTLIAGCQNTVIPNNVTSIGEGAFRSCSGLTSIMIPNSVTSIGEDAFRDCSNLTSVTIGNSVTSIGGNAFSNCSGLTSVTIPNSVTRLGDYAFYACSNLTSITIPNGVTSIGDCAFYNCSGLTSITIPNSVTSIGSSAFYGCSGLTSINVDSNNSIYDSRDNCNAIIEKASNTLIAGCQNTVIPNSVTNIGRGAFGGCSSLTSITIPNSVTSIGEYAFYGCSGMTFVTIPNSVTSIGVWAFAACSGLTSVIVNWKIPIVKGTYVFLYSNYLEAALYIPKGTKELYESAGIWRNFGDIVEMDEITIGDEGMGTYCSTHALDFSGTDDIKAYIVSAFKPSTGEVTLTRITDVPANTGIVVKGAAGTYSIPMGPGETIVSNMLRGVTTNTVLNKVEGEYTNYILAKKNGNLGFYAVVDGSTLSAHKAYLPLPTASLPSGARSIKLVFEDGGTTGISEASRLNDNGEMINDNIYDLQGRRVEKPTRGLYIVNGRKVVIK
jgi:hypothetical protein